MRTRSFKPAAETLEDRLAPGTLTVVNDTTKLIYVQIVRHHTASDLTESSYTEWTGSYTIKPGTARDFNPGDSRPSVRVSTGGSRYYTLGGSGISLDSPRYIYLNDGYRFTRQDGHSDLNVTIGNHNYGSRSTSSLRSLGVTTMTGFYAMPNDETITINGPNKITGSMTFSFQDYSGNLETKHIQHVFSTPHGTTITSFNIHPTSSRGDHVSFYKFGNELVESGSISGGGPFSSGGSYVGTVQVTYAYA
jgi:hypothetical protein